MHETIRLIFFGWSRLKQEWEINGAYGVWYLIFRRVGGYGFRRLAARSTRFAALRNLLDPFAATEALASAGRLTEAIANARAKLDPAAESAHALRYWRHAWTLLADLLVIDGQMMEASAIYDRVLAIARDDFTARWGAENLQRRLATTPGASRPIAIHFFTIVLNGMPLVRHHIEELRKLPFEWHWHIVEGIAELRHDTAWSKAHGGRAAESLHRNGLSIDGTSEYLDELAAREPKRITLYRAPNGRAWDGKIEMVRAPLARIVEECLLWEIDVDEFWSADQIETMRERFIQDPNRTAAFFLCHYFIRNLVITTANTYGNHVEFEWLRVWRYRPGDFWASHEPPRLCRPLSAKGIAIDLAEINPFMHGETLRDDLVFRHLAYVLPEQLRFKETYYGYKNALAEWKQLPAHGPLRLRDYLSWINDNAIADNCVKYGIASPASGVASPDSLATVASNPSSLFRAATSDIDLSRFRNILVVKLDNIGDAVLLSPFLRELRANTRAARITLVVRKQIYDVVALCPHVDRIVPIDVAGWSKSFRCDDAQFNADYEAKTFDLAIVPRWDSDEFGAGRIARQSGARRVVGISEGVSRRKARENLGFDQNYTDTLLDMRPVHAVVQTLALLRFMNGAIASDALEAWIDPANHAAAERLLEPLGAARDVIAVCPGASYPGKIFPAELLLRILDTLPSHYRFVLLGDGSDRRAAEVLQEALGERTLMLCGNTSLREAIAVLHHSRAAITMDSALAHFAAAVETPVVVFSMQARHGSNNMLDQSPIRFGPWCPPDRQLVIQPDHVWPGCENGCRWRSSRPHCIGAIDIKAASDAIGTFLSRHVQSETNGSGISAS